MILNIQFIYSLITVDKNNFALSCHQYCKPMSAIVAIALSIGENN
ncbi:hypothetical protein [Nostoc sp.]